MCIRDRLIPFQYTRSFSFSPAQVKSEVIRKGNVNKMCIRDSILICAFVAEIRGLSFCEDDISVQPKKGHYRMDIAPELFLKRNGRGCDDNRLDADAAVKSVLEQFSPERVRYVLANTIQQKNFDGRIPQPLKEWAKSVEVCPENASRFLVDKPNPGLTALSLIHI